MTVHAQQDWGSSLTLEQSKKLFRKFEITLGEEFRLRDDFSTPDRIAGDLSVSYKPVQYLKAGVAYNPICFNHEKQGWEMRHRYYAYASGSYTFERFTLSLRERFQSTYRVGVEETAKRANPKQFLRSRLKLEYDVRKSGFEPYLSLEFYKPLNDPVDNRMNKIRYTAGTMYKINRRHALELFYRYTNFRDDDDTNGNHMIGLGYAFRF
ncbi:MAG: DUF2490 domain-containing protein [Tannerella sp.]|nr:DUF2490 domain-containing protein [Tannerella sp.]